MVCAADRDGDVRLDIVMETGNTQIFRPNFDATAHTPPKVACVFTETCQPVSLQQKDVRPRNTYEADESAPSPHSFFSTLIFEESVKIARTNKSAHFDRQLLATSGKVLPLLYL
jgi:hypothetical protein